MNALRSKKPAIPVAKTQPAWQIWMRRSLTGISLFFALLLFLFLVGVFFPAIPYVGESGTIFESFFSLSLVMMSVIVGFLAYAVLRLGGKRVALVGFSLSLITTIGFCVPLGALIQIAGVYHTNLSWSQQLIGGLSIGTPDVSKSVQFATTPDGKTLFMDISKPSAFTRTSFGSLDF